MGAVSDRQGLGRTQAADEAVRAADAQREQAGATAAPRLAQPGILERLLARGRALGGTGERYRVEGLLGVGGGGRVFAATDGNLDRQVALKIAGDPSDDGARHFIDEARITAALSHPNVLPVYELDLTEDGEIYYTMKRIEGRSLAATLDDQTQELALNDIVRVFIAVGQALAYAHHRGVIHQDVKPDNIMLGGFGEVLLVDWGSAARLSEVDRLRIYGTPLYMSPEQARVESADERSDIYGLGASLFHALVGRLPTWADDPEQFWERKRRGEIDAPTDAERRRVPPALLAIALKAMAPRPTERYAKTEEFVADLTSYQAGLAVTAYAEPLLARFQRWHRRHARVLWSSLSVAAVIVSLSGLLLGERLKERVHWGEPLPIRDVGDPHFDEDWTVFAGDFERRGDRVVSTAEKESLLMCKRQLSGAIAVEYDAEILPDSKPCDVSLVWFPRLTDDGKQLADQYRLQIGALDASCCQIACDADGVVAFSYLRPVAGRVYHVRDEIEGDRITMLVDGQEICSYRAAVPFSAGYIALRAYYPGKAFSHVRIHARGVPERLPATALGDLLVQKKRYDEAAEEYRRVAVDHQGARIGEEALYRCGLCSFWQHRYETAFAIWKPLTGARWDQLLRLHRLDRLFAEKDPGIFHEIEDLYRGASPEIRHRIAFQWTRYLAGTSSGTDTRFLPRAGREEIEPWLALHDRLFNDDIITDAAAARALQVTGRWSELLRRYPRQRYLCGMALYELGRFDLLYLGYLDQSAWEAVGRFDTANYDGLAPTDSVYPWSLFKRGQFDEAMRLYPDSRDIVAGVLLARGDIDGSIAASGSDQHLKLHALLISRRLDEAAAAIAPDDRYHLAELAIIRDQPEIAWNLTDPEDPLRHPLKYQLGLEAWIRGDRQTAERWFATELWPERYAAWEYRQFLVPFLRGLAGDHAALDAACRETITDYRYLAEQHPYFCARFLLGEIGDADFLAQPARAFVRAPLERCRGMRAERAGRIDEAVAAYRAYLAMPVWQRSYDVDNAIWDRFVRWRLEQLGAAPLPQQGAP